MARPQIEISKTEFEKLCSLQCTLVEIADYFDCSEDTIERWCKREYKRNIARVKWSGLFGMEKEPDRKRVHPTQKPVNLASWFIEKYSKQNDTVVDLFGGSGSTLLACEQLDRRCFMCELDEHYCDVILQRWENFTGEKAVLING